MAGVSMAGIALGDSILATALGSMGPATASASFPQFEYQWDPSQPGAPPSATSPWSDFVLRSVVRPKFQWGDVAFDYGAGHPDWSGAARVAVWGTALTAAGLLVYVLWRAFAPRSRSNPTYRTVTAVRHSPFALARARRSA
jgi:hypothetical protein